MPLSDELWKCGNDYDTEVTYKRGTALQARPNAGVCAGQSALWCYNMESGVRDIHSKPDLMRAMILQRLYDWSNDRGQLCEQVGLQIDETRDFGTYQAACTHMRQKRGTYYITLYGHGVAANVDDFVCFFDPNFGCYRFGGGGRLLELLGRAASAVGITTTSLRTIEVSVDG